MIMSMAKTLGLKSALLPRRGFRYESFKRVKKTMTKTKTERKTRLLA